MKSKPLKIPEYHQIYCCTRDTKTSQDEFQRLLNETQAEDLTKKGNERLLKIANINKLEYATFVRNLEREYSSVFIMQVKAAAKQ